MRAKKGGDESRRSTRAKKFITVSFRGWVKFVLYFFDRVANNIFQYYKALTVKNFRSLKIFFKKLKKRNKINSLMRLTGIRRFYEHTKTTN